MDITRNKYKENTGLRIASALCVTGVLAILITFDICFPTRSTAGLIIEIITGVMWSVITLINTISFIRFLVNKKKEVK